MQSPYRPDPIPFSSPPLAALTARLAALYEKMDDAYRRVAERYGFRCTGCEDNCCRTLFYHHTHLEYYYLLQGVAAADEDRQRTFRRRAADVCRAYAAEGPQSGYMCPLNEGGPCGLYTHRTMICRLHGLPHHFVRPDGQTVHGPGCALFTERHGHMAYVPLDRTPLYRELAELEWDFRKAFDIDPRRRLKLTIAQMLVPENHETRQKE